MAIFKEFQSLENLERKCKDFHRLARAPKVRYHSAEKIQTSVIGKSVDKVTLQKILGSRLFTILALLLFFIFIV